MIKVSVIVPVYGAEKYMAHCTSSLMEQTMDEVELLFIDDKGPDNSIEILKETLAKYPTSKKIVRIISHDENKGLPSARNTGIEAATGEYIFHCDDDDWVEPTLLSDMYNAAKKQDADVLWTDWFLSFEKKERYIKQPSYETAIEALKGILSGTMRFMVWNKLVKRSIYIDNEIRFPSGYTMGEDMTMMKVFACSQSVCYIPKAYYHYTRTNPTAITRLYSAKRLMELHHNVDDVEKFLQDKFGDNLDKEIAFMKLEAKIPFLISNGKDGMYKLWTEWYPEANKFIMQNTAVSLRRRLLQWCAWKKQFWIVWLHYYVVNQLIYGIIYK